MSAYSDRILSDGAASYWRLGESSGTNADDANTTNNNDGTYTGSVTLGVQGALLGDANTAVSLPGGTGNYITVPDNNSLDLLDTMTFECWVKRAATGSVMGLIHKTGTSGPDFRFHSDDRIRMTRNGTNIVASTTTITDTTKWHHLVMTKATSTAKLYIDGVDRTGTVTNLAMSNTANVLLIGAVTTTLQSFNGAIDEVAVYPTALSAQTVLDHYLLGRGRTIGIATVTNDALSLGRRKSKAIGIASVFDDAMTVGGLAPAREIDSAIALSRTKQRAIAAALEFDVAARVFVPIIRPVGIALELDAAQVVVAQSVLPHWLQDTETTWPVTAGTAWAQSGSTKWATTTEGTWPQDTDDNWS